jgi:hypothetical protein
VVKKFFMYNIFLYLFLNICRCFVKKIMQLKESFSRSLYVAYSGKNQQRRKNKRGKAESFSVLVGAGLWRLLKETPAAVNSWPSPGS